MSKAQKKNSPSIFVLEGTSASGKTTLLQYLSGLDHSEICLVPEAARMFYEENEVPKEERSSYNNQTKIQKRFQAELDKAIETKSSIIITDSSPLSCIVYSMLGKDKETVQKLTTNISNKLHQYTEFFLFDPTDIDYHYDPRDPVRMETEAQRIRVHQNLVEVIRSLRLPVHLIRGTVKQRVQKIMERIEKHHAKNIST